ncbi:MAG: hypothetical protein JXA61_09475 [Bacteroidales bacterium]|nr:hypothetical protein [Bacteroidales bacterium]
MKRSISAKLKGTLLIFLITGIASCGEKVYYGEVDCSECYQIRPDSADLIVRLTLNGGIQEVPLTFYRGNIEGGVVECVDTAFTDPYYLWVAVEQAYSVKAEYYHGGKVVYAVDGTTIEILKVPDACDEECYIINGETLDVRLKPGFP